MAFVPVYFGYERIVESHTFEAEVEGKQKNQRTYLISLRYDHLKMILVLLVNFSSPIALSNFVEAKTVKSSIAKYQNSDQRSKFLSSELALHLACKINESSGWTYQYFRFRVRSIKGREFRQKHPP